MYSFYGIITKEIKKIIAFVVIFFMCTIIMHEVMVKADIVGEKITLSDEISIISEIKSKNSKNVIIKVDNSMEIYNTPLLSENILNCLRDDPDKILIIKFENKRFEVRSHERQIQITINDIVSSGFISIGKDEYYLDIDGFIETGWVKTPEDNKWYHLNDKTGIKNKNWFKDNGYWYYLDKITGEMKTGWIQDDGKWYYLYNNGILA